MDHADHATFTAVDTYIAQLFVPPDPALDAALAATEAAGMPTISVSPAQGSLLHVLAKVCNARRILELGTLGGYSTIWLARALPPDGRLITIEYNADHAEVARQNIARAGLADQVEVRVGAGLDVLPQLVAEGVAPFDMIFLDADKEPMPEYLTWAIRLARQGTLIIGDNVVRDGKVLSPAPDDTSMQGIARFNAALAQHPALTATIMQSVGSKGYDGMALAVVTNAEHR